MDRVLKKVKPKHLDNIFSLNHLGRFVIVYFIIISKCQRRRCAELLLWFGKIIEFYKIFDEWGFWFEIILLNCSTVQLAIRLAESFGLLVLNKKIEADEQPLQ